jgi:hypothetical protein
MVDQLISFETAKLAKTKGFKFGNSLFNYEVEHSEDGKTVHIPALNLTIDSSD